MRWLWIDRITELVPGQRLVAIKCVSSAEEHLRDHFPAQGTRLSKPIHPMSLIIEGMAQSAGILVGYTEKFKQKVILAKVTRAEMSDDVGPGETLRFTATIRQITPQGASTEGLIERMDHGIGEHEFTPIGRCDLLFSHIDQNMAGLGFPEHNFVFGEGFKTLLRISDIEFDFDE